jgi:hypothetical protein
MTLNKTFLFCLFTGDSSQILELVEIAEDLTLGVFASMKLVKMNINFLMLRSIPFFSSSLKFLWNLQLVFPLPSF